jgi:pyruvate,water dikinase
VSRAGRFRLLLALTQGSISLRERARMKQALLYTRFRHVVLAAGRHLAARGLLSEAGDVFGLTVDEVRDLLRGGNHAPAAACVVSRARLAAMEETRGASPPDRMVLRAGEVWGAQADGAPGRGTGAFVGTPACGGVFEGEAVVVRDVTEADRIQAGQILVTSQTDPGWAAVFFLVKGLVVERGGMLSHGAIIAREYGIPAVVGVAGATSLIADGARLRVDGDQGHVEVLHA